MKSSPHSGAISLRPATFFGMIDVFTLFSESLRPEAEVLEFSMLP